MPLKKSCSVVTVSLQQQWPRFVHLVKSIRFETDPTYSLAAHRNRFPLPFVFTPCTVSGLPWEDWPKQKLIFEAYSVPEMALPEVILEKFAKAHPGGNFYREIESVLKLEHG